MFAESEGAGMPRPAKFMPGVTRAPRRIKGKKYVRRFTEHRYPQSTSNLKLGR